MAALGIVSRMRLVVWAFIYISNVHSFNLDTRIPILKKMNNGDGSYFGFSVAQHQINDPNNAGAVLENVLLVGAPKGNVSFTDLSNVARPGVVYKCPVSTIHSECEALDIILDVGKDEDYEDQWLGVTVRSQGRGKKVMACAHRFERKSWAPGMCHILTPELDYDMSKDPCTGQSVNKAHEEYGYCQAGMSAEFAEGDDVVIGMPGPGTWRGALAVNSVSDALSASYTWFHTSIYDSAVGLYSYLGYAVTSGTFGQNEVSYVGGAPRSNGTGEVVFFTKGKNALHYTASHIIPGKIFGSSFGFSVLAVDLNNDGYDDLIVGSPFHFNTTIGGAIYIYLGSTGGITKFTEPQTILSRTMTENECMKINCQEARFGLSLATLGDLNKDGFQDFAVGAPYDRDGAVYIYHGTKDGIIGDYSQIIHSKDVKMSGAPAKTFGYSLSGGMDLDENQYPDLLVGAYESDTVYLLRSRPIIKLIPVVTITPELIDPDAPPFCQPLSLNRHCIKIKVCLQITTDQSSLGNPTIIYSILAEGDRHLQRVDFHNMPPGAKNTTFIQREVIVRDGNTPCRTDFAILKETFTDKLRPIRFEFNYQLKDIEPIPPAQGDPIPSMNKYPVLDADSIRNAELIRSVSFANDCGVVCESDLQFTAKAKLPIDINKNPVLSLGEDDPLVIQFELTNLGQSAYETRLYLTIPQELLYEGVDFVGDENQVNCEPLNETMVHCPEIGNPFPNQASVVFSIKLETKKVPASQKHIDLLAHVVTTSSDLDLTDNYHEINILTVVRADIGVSGRSEPESTIFGGTVRGESATKYEDEIGIAVNHTYTIYNEGPGTVEASTLNIYWPYEVENGEPQGKHLLYLMQAPVIEQGPVECIVDPKFINPAGVKENPNFILRSRRVRRAKAQTAEVGTRTARQVDNGPVVGESKQASGKRIVSLNCKDNTAKCHKMVCKIRSLEDGASGIIIVRARLWESTLLDDYTFVDSVRIQSNAELLIDPLLNIEQKSTGSNIAFATTVAIPDVVIAERPPLAWWIILVAVLGGVILLGILIAVLWKLGFFKRKIHEDSETHQVKVDKKKDMDDI